jgi:Cof subfamily protein (haloacid dehalogenase superfamily)
MDKANPRKQIDGIAVIALDLDGTLLHTDETISARALAAICACAARGMQIIIATARPHRSVMARLPQDFPAGPWICCNGAEIYENDECIFEQAIPPERAREIVALLEALSPKMTVSAEMEDRLYANVPLATTWEYQVCDLQTALVRPVTKIIFDAGKCEMAGLQEKLGADVLLQVTDDQHGRFGQIGHHAVSKARALKFLLARGGRTMAEVMAFGDNSVDSDMLCAAGLGVAVGNALPEVKAIADRITGTNDEDGVAMVLEELLKEYF